ncbi:MBL fold metallo-hydrolase [Plantactinospora veratri]
MLSRSVGPVTVVALPDAEGLFFQPRTEAFPTATAAQWRLADERDPGAVTADGQWRLPFRCFALRFDDGPAAGRVILVDAGIGPADAPARSWAPVPGRLPAELAAAGIAPEQVDTVVLTHLHTDHVGWAVTGGAGAPYFGNARYLLQQAEIAAFRRHDPAGVTGYLLDPLTAAGQLDALDGDLRLAPGIRIVATPATPPGTSRCWSSMPTRHCCSPATCWCTRCSWSRPSCRTPTRATRSPPAPRGSGSSPSWPPGRPPRSAPRT